MSNKYLDYKGLASLIEITKPEALEDSYINNLFDDSVIIEPVYTTNNEPKISMWTVYNADIMMFQRFSGFINVTQNGSTRSAELNCYYDDNGPIYEFQYGILGTNNAHLETKQEIVPGGFSGLKVLNKDFEENGTCSVVIEVLGHTVQIDGVNLEAIVPGSTK